jgi:thymidylate synthase (FAD)
MQRVESKVQLVQHTPEPEQLIASSARLCYASETAGILEPDADAGKFVAMLRRLGHLSPLEHASYTFLVEGVSRAMTHQLVRHRLASYSQRSQRYVAHGDFDYICPPQLAGKTVTDENGQAVDAETYFGETMEMIGQRYRRLVEAMGDEGEATNQDARYVLPNACETKIFVTMNARELLHFFEERLCMRAQWEIRGVADAMLSAARPTAPAVFKNAGPKCVRLGYCPEGAKTCGRLDAMRRRYGS